MKRHRRILFTIAAFYLLYTLIAHHGALTSPNAEHFPVFNWALFSIVSDEISLVDVEITALDGKSLPQPTLFFDLPGHFNAAKWRDVTILKLVYKAYRKLARGDEDAFQDYRRVLESVYLADHDLVAYRLVLNRFNPIERYRNGTVLSTQVVWEGRKGEGYQ